MKKSDLKFKLGESMVSIKEFFTTLLTAFFLFVLPLLLLSKFAKAESIEVNEVNNETAVFFPLLSDIDLSSLSKLNSLSSYLGFEEFPALVSLRLDQDGYQVFDLYRTQLDNLADTIIRLKSDDVVEFEKLIQMFSEELINFAVKSRLQLWKFPAEFSGICFNGNGSEVAYILQAAYESFMVDDFNMIAWRFKTSELNFYPEVALSELSLQWPSVEAFLTKDEVDEEDEAVHILSNLSEELVDIKYSVVPMCPSSSR